jgi:hypothetical protein
VFKTIILLRSDDWIAGFDIFPETISGICTTNVPLQPPKPKLLVINNPENLFRENLTRLARSCRINLLGGAN